MSSDKFHCTNGHCLTDCALSSIDYDKDLPPRFCPYQGSVVRWKKHETTEKKPSLFDKITISPEVLAESVVHTYEMAIGGSMFRVYWTSPFVDNLYLDKSEAIAATVAKLKGEIK